MLAPQHDPKVVQARIQDGYQYRPFALLLYAHRLTGQKKYFEGARRCCDWMIQVQNPRNGNCPDQFDSRLVDQQKAVTGTGGVLVGGSYNDGATSDPARMTIMMYHLTRDPEYLERTAKIGQWIFHTQLGKGQVRGKYLERVRARWMRADVPGMPERDGGLCTGALRQVWQSPHTWTEPYRPPFGWAQWQYVWDARPAQGEIDAETAAPGARALEFMHVWESWDVMGDWTTRAVKVEDWLTIPLRRARTTTEQPARMTNANTRRCVTLHPRFAGIGGGRFSELRA